MEKFIIERHKKDGSIISPVKIRKGFWVEPHPQSQEGIIYYPGTLVPHIHYMAIKKYDLFNQLKGGPMPWTDPQTIQVNKDLLSTENIYLKIEEAKKTNNTEQIAFLSKPLVTWICPQSLQKKAIYSNDITIHNRNSKSDFVFEHTNRFDEAIIKLQQIFEQEGVKTSRGIAALINLLSAKFCFRAGNDVEKKRTGVGVTTFRPKNIKIEADRMYFSFRGKKGVKWYKGFKPSTPFEQLMYNGLVELKEKNKEFLFTLDQRIDSTAANNLFREVLDVKDNEKEFLSFHSWRHYNASKAFSAALSKITIKRKLNKIERGKSKEKDLVKARLLNKSINDIFKRVAKILNDTPGVVKTTYAGSKILKDFYEQNGVEYDEKRRSYERKS